MKKYTILLISFLTACSSSNSLSFGNSSSNKKSDTVSKGNSTYSSDPLTDFENISFAFTSSRQLVPFGEGDKLLYPGTAVEYCDPSVSDHFTYYCFEPGCKHMDNTCHAYIGNAEGFISYKGLWYYDRKKDNNQFEIICHNPDTNERKVIASYERSDNGNVWEYINTMMISHDFLYVTVTRMSTANNSLDSEVTSRIEKINLKDYSHKTIVDENNCSYFGGNGEKAVVEYSEPRSGIDGSVNQYFELRIYNMDGSGYQLIADSDHGFYEYSDMYQLVNGNNVVYIKQNEVHLLNLHTMEDKVVYSSMNKLVRTWFFGNMICFLEETDNVDSVFMVDMDGNNKKEYPGLMDTENSVLKVSYTYLTEHGQIANSSWISEKDYLNCNFDHRIEK